MTGINLKLSDSEIESLDLARFNDGVNPFGEADSSLNDSYKNGVNFFREYVQTRTNFKGGKKVLDLLCGFGRWLPFLAEANDHVLGLERIPDCVNLAKNYCNEIGADNVEFMQGDVSNIEKLPADSFDYIWMYSALQYVDRGYVLWQVQRVLKPEGRVFISQYNTTGLMLKHFWSGVENNSINEGASQWALNALSKGPDGDGNPNFATLDMCDSLCARHGLSLIAAAPCCALDLNAENFEIPELRQEKVFEHYYKTIEFIAEKQEQPYRGHFESLLYRINHTQSRIASLKRFINIT